MNFLYLEQIESTNKYAKENIKSISDGTVVYTFKQTEGRGRLQRKWNFVGEENIYTSIILKPSKKMKEVYSNLTQLLCLVLAKTFEEYGVEPKIKWPNDIRIHKKKISGILAESVISSTGGLEGIVLGFGVNLNASQNALNEIEQNATSLDIETGRYIDKEIFLKKVLSDFCLLYNRFIEEGFLLIREDYKKRAEFLNEEISVRVFDKVVTGIAIDVTENGALKIKDKNDQEYTLLIGDIL